MKTELKDLVIGRKYKVKPLEWFKQKENDEHATYGCLSYAGEELFLDEIVNGSQLVLRRTHKYQDGEVWLNPEAVEEIPGQTEPSKEILDAVDKLKKENYIYGYDGGPGGGEGGTINTQEDHILPVFEKDGSQSVYIKVASCKRTFTIERINELFEKGETEQSFEATQWTTIRTNLKLIKDKKKLPERSRWETMRD